jgi:catechol 2,3-dioxygenase-like lactoylglutathione lyase family enzyme
MNVQIGKIVTPYSEPVRGLILRFFEENEAARVYLDEAGHRGWPVILDHITIRCMDVEARAREFLKLGYEDHDERVEYPDQGWWAKVYRKKGYPGLFIDQAYADARGKENLLPAWVKKFGDRLLHHVAVRVDGIDAAVEALKGRGVEFSGKIVGAPGTRLRQIFTAAEVRDGDPFSVLELAERNGYDGFYPEQADSLMQASTKKKG